MNIEDLKETAALAHLNLDETELAAAFPAFEQMLGYFAAMQTADADEAAFPAAAPGPVQALGASHFRGDNASPGPRGEALVSRLLENPGERDGRFVVVPNVL